MAMPEVTKKEISKQGKQSTLMQRSLSGHVIICPMKFELITNKILCFFSTVDTLLAPEEGLV